ncbi:hypothetical protein BD410DRAFT_748191 [Rickenella mellea]|uniref:AIG1-type G domain-containing protein n=1 Tax=Rickenella mellea TaxID=50990 RepID=A0A4Y7Q546_9AGAM|nr:hypothetical protein BD410DRAFT_748191 [Rickenella mellea]
MAGFEPSTNIIVIAGSAGVGKTTFINALAPHANFGTGTDTSPCTRNIQDVRACVDGVEVVLVDTPGFEHTFTTHEAVWKSIYDWLEASDTGDLPLLSVIYLHRMSELRSSGSSFEQMQMLRRLCDTAAFSSVALVTTMLSGDQDIGLVESTQEEQMRNPSGFWKALIDRGAGWDRFDGSAESASRIVKRLLNDAVQPLYISLQPQTCTTSAAPGIQRTDGSRDVSVTLRMTQTVRKLRRAIINAPFLPISQTRSEPGTKLIVVFGSSSDGKPFINDLVPHPKFSHLGVSSRTQVSFRVNLDGIDIVVVDTPGFKDSNVPDFIALGIMAQWLSANINRYCAEHQLLGVIYDSSLGNDRLNTKPTRWRRLFRRHSSSSSAIIATIPLSSVEGLRQSHRDHQVSMTSEKWKTLLRNNYSLVRRKPVPKLVKYIVKALDGEVTPFTIDANSTNLTTRRSKETDDEEQHDLSRDSVASAINNPKTDRTSKDTDLVGNALNSSSPKKSIYIMGPTGAGKTSFINAVTQSQYTTSSGLRSSTNSLQESTLILHGETITLVDTPGFDDTRDLSDMAILEMIGRSMTQEGNDVVGILYLHRISDNKIGGTATRQFRFLQAICGDAFWRIILVTTMGDSLPQAMYDERVQELSSSRDWWRRLVEGGSEIMDYDGSHESGVKIVDTLLTSASKEDKRLALQVELQHGMSIYSTSAATQAIL